LEIFIVGELSAFSSGVLIFCNKNWTAAAMYSRSNKLIKTHKNSILQINANTHIRAFYCEHGMSDSRIILHIAIQAKKIDVDFRGDSLATNKGMCGKHCL